MLNYKLNLQMDIVSRLKEFITSQSIAITQFADNCNIARPTLSQLLNGRNKKVSDELITKIHEAYPQLSVLWLMFGEGTMLHNENIKTSEPQANPFFGFDSTQNVENEEGQPRIDFEKSYTENDSISEDNIQNIIPGLKSTPVSIDPESGTSEIHKSTITFNPYAKKRIVNIIVYYDDNSFESFVPGPKK